jgi:hypothetical protein
MWLTAMHESLLGISLLSCLLLWRNEKYAWCSLVYLAALLHDVGTILVEDMLLNKQGILTLDELRHVQERSALADEVLRPILDDEEVLKSIRHNRERYDGTGYPGGLWGGGMGHPLWHPGAHRSGRFGHLGYAS